MAHAKHDRQGNHRLTVDKKVLRPCHQVGIGQERAAEIMMQTGPVIQLVVAKQAASFHGLETLLFQPSPVMSRSSSSTLAPPTPATFGHAGVQPVLQSPGNLQEQANHYGPIYNSAGGPIQVARLPSPTGPTSGVSQKILQF